MKKLFLLLLFIPCMMYGQETDSILFVNELVKNLEKLPVAYQKIVTEVLLNSEKTDEKMTYILPSGEIVSSFLGEEGGLNKFWECIYNANTITEICNVPFGSTYEKAKGILMNKYGDYEHLYSNKDDIVYKNKNYAGVDFNSMHFMFNSDGTRSYFSGAIFAIDCKTKSEAIKTKEILHGILSKRYIGFSKYDYEGEYLSMGGLPPIPTKRNYGFGVRIDILDYGKVGTDLGTPYAVRLMYGPYDYVKEEF